MQNNNLNFAKNAKSDIGTSEKQVKKISTSTFAKVRNNKNTQVQVLMDQGLAEIIGKLFGLVAASIQVNVDRDSGESHTSTIYDVRTLTRSAKAKTGTLLRIKVKDQKPIIDDDELTRLSLGEAKPIVLRFIDIAHYAYIGGESLNATNVEKVNISPVEASKL